MNAHLALEPFEVVMLAAGAIDLIFELADLEAAELVIPDIDIDQILIDGFEVASQNLDGFGGLQAGDDINRGREDACCFAGISHARRRGWLRPHSGGRGSGRG